MVHPSAGRIVAARSGGVKSGRAQPLVRVGLQPEEAAVVVGELGDEDVLQRIGADHRPPLPARAMRAASFSALRPTT